MLIAAISHRVLPILHLPPLGIQPDVARLEAETIMRDRRTEADRAESDERTIPPPIPAFSLSGSLSPLFLGPITALVMIALFAPENVLDRSMVARAFTRWVEAQAPFITEHADSTKYPQVALLTNCLSIALVPLLALVWMAQSFLNYPQLLERQRVLRSIDLKTYFFMIFLMVPIMLASMYVMVGIAGDPSWANGFTTQRRRGLAALNGLMVYLSSLAAGGWPLSVRLFIDLNLRSNSHGR